MNQQKRWAVVAAAWLMLLLAVTPVQAQTHETRIDELEAKAVEMAEELEALRTELQHAKRNESSQELEAIREQSTAAQQAAQRAEQSASEWKDATSVAHLAGYASADYVSPENVNAAFIANFNPMFHFQYVDRILWEAELEIEVAGAGLSPDRVHRVVFLVKEIQGHASVADQLRPSGSHDFS